MPPILPELLNICILPRRYLIVHDKRGLPSDAKMRHEKHYVEELFKDLSSGAEYRLVDIKNIALNEEQPRKDVGDLEGLAVSITEKGVLEPILLRRAGEQYSIISGERRFRAAEIAGLSSIPAIILHVDDLDTLQIALIENLQRKDLTPFEEADAYLMLLNRFNLTHEIIAGKIGKSRINVTETIKLSRIPETIRDICFQNGITSKSILIEIARIQDITEMKAFAEEIASKGMSRSDIRNRKRPVKKFEGTKPYIFKYKPENKSFRLNLMFKKPQVDKSEIIQALMKIIDELRDKP
jgi:ParB family chromosome partitioning protein